MKAKLIDKTYLRTDISLEEKFNLCHRDLYRYICHIIISRGYYISGMDRDDIAQHGMMRIYRDMRKYDPLRGMQPHVYVYMAVNRQIITMLRRSLNPKRDPLKTYSLLTPIGKDGKTIEDWLMEQPTQTEGLQLNMVKDRWEYLSERLRPLLTQPQLYIYNYMLKDMTETEIVRATGLSQKKVDNMMYKIRLKAKDLAKSIF